MTARKTIAFLLISIFLSIPAAYAKVDYHGVPSKGSAQKGATAVAVCSACHGVDGNSASPTYPNLAAQKYNYIIKQLEDFRDLHRKSSIMTGMAMTIPSSSNHQNLENIAAYFSSQKLKRAEGANANPAAATPAELKLGSAVYRNGSAKEGVPACSACHGLGGEGNDPMAIPALAGQHAAYVIQQLDQFASGTRDNSPGRVMAKIAHAMSTQQKKAVAAYMERLDPATVLGADIQTYGEHVKAVLAKPTKMKRDTSSSSTGTVKEGSGQAKVKKPENS